MDFRPIPETIDGLPNLCGERGTTRCSDVRVAILSTCKETNLRLDRLQSVFAIALHMQQPLIPAGGGDIRTADIDQQSRPHDAQSRHRRQPQRHRLCRLLRPHGRHHPRAGERGQEPAASCSTTPASCCSACARWAAATCSTGCGRSRLDPHYRRYAEWLGTMWGHAVASSTPLPDLKLHMRAWQHNFAAIFGWDALARVKGFSPPEMHLPNHPDAAYEYVKALKECGYQWLLVQEHTVETLDGRACGISTSRIGCVAKNSSGEEIVDHRHHQDAGLGHQAGGPDAAVLRGQGDCSPARSAASVSRRSSRRSATARTAAS